MEHAIRIMSADELVSARMEAIRLCAVETLRAIDRELGRRGLDTSGRRRHLGARLDLSQPTVLA